MKRTYSDRGDDEEGSSRRRLRLHDDRELELESIRLREEEEALDQEIREIERQTAEQEEHALQQERKREEEDKFARAMESKIAKRSDKHEGVKTLQELATWAVYDKKRTKEFEENIELDVYHGVMRDPSNAMKMTSYLALFASRLTSKRNIPATAAAELYKAFARRSFIIYAQYGEDEDGYIDAVASFLNERRNDVSAFSQSVTPKVFMSAFQRGWNKAWKELEERMQLHFIFN